MSNIHVDNYGSNRPFDSTVSQMIGTTKKTKPNDPDTPGNTDINTLPFDINTVFLNKKYTGTATNQVIDLPSTDFVKYGGVLWFKALNDTTPHAFFNLRFGFGQMLIMPGEGGLTLTDNNEIYDLTKTQLVLKGNARFTNKAGIDYQVIGFVIRKDFFYTCSVNHVYGRSEKVPMVGKIRNVGAIIQKAVTPGSNGRWSMWHRSLSNSASIAFDFNDPGSSNVATSITLNASNELVLNPSLRDGEYMLMVFGHSPDGSVGIFSDTYADHNVKYPLPFSPGFLMDKSLYDLGEEKSGIPSDIGLPWAFLNREIGWYENQDDNVVTQAAEVMTSGKFGSPLDDGFITSEVQGKHIFIAVQQNKTIPTTQANTTTTQP